MATATAAKPKQKEDLPPITEAMRAQAATILKKAKVQLTVNHPFWAQIVLHRRITISDKCSTAFITKRGYITIGTRFLAGLTVQQAVFLLAHEAMHYAMLHMLRRKHREPRKWNVAGDAVINDLLQAAKVGEFIEGGVNMPGSKDKTAEQVYEALPPSQGKGKGKKGAGSGEPDYSPGEGWDDMDGEDSEVLDEATIREIEESARQELAAAAAAAKQAGNMPAGMEKHIDEIINPKTPWHKVLEPYMVRLVRGNTTWARPNRRFAAHGVYLPSTDKIPQMGTVVIQSDESGSINDQMRAHFGGHINKILELCRPERVLLLHTDTHVHKDVEEFTPDDFPIKFTTKCCGGTDMTAGIRWVQDNGIEPDVLICLTDGYTPWPDKEPGFDTVWLVTTDQKSPVGLTIPYDMDDNEGSK